MIDENIEKEIEALSREQAQAALNEIFERLDRVREQAIALQALLHAQITVIDVKDNHGELGHEPE
jgi:excinuclease UvrABC nuclease subunit